MKVGIYLDDEDNRFKAGLTPGWNPVYRDSLVEALNSFGPIFESARLKSEFEFITALLRVRGEFGPGWDAWENTIEVLERMKLLHDQADYETASHLWLWIYGHIVEASEPYEILANMLRISAGGRWMASNFPDKVRRDGSKVAQAPGDKIQTLHKLAADAKMATCTSPLKRLIDRNLRNAVFHSDYSVYDGNVRIFKPATKEYSRDDVLARVNHALAYIEAIKFFVQNSIADYKMPKTIAVPAGFSPDPDEKAVVMVRTGTGAVGLRDNWTKEEIAGGKIPFRLGRFKRYELKLLKSDPSLVWFPRDRVKIANRVLSWLPRLIRSKLVRIAKSSEYF